MKGKKGEEWESEPGVHQTTAPQDWGGFMYIFLLFDGYPSSSE